MAHQITRLQVGRHLPSVREGDSMRLVSLHTLDNRADHPVVIANWNGYEEERHDAAMRMQLL